MGIDWLQLVACALAIGYAGARLTGLADAISRQTGVSGSYVGLLLLAAVTSLPELATAVSAVTTAHAPDIAVGGALGSITFNLALLVVLDMLYRPDTIYSRAGMGHVVSAGFGVILLALVGAGLLLEQEHVLPDFGPIGIYTPLIAVLYLIALRTVFSYERGEAGALPTRRGLRKTTFSLQNSLLQFAAFAVIVTVAGTWLPIASVRIADEMGWTQTLVGTLMVAAATSMPELVVTLAALRLGALDMAIAGLLGSNLFDLFIVAIADAFYTKGPLLAAVAPVHAVTAFAAAMMSGAVIVGFVYRPHQRVLRTMSVVSAALLAMYLTNVFVLFGHRQ